MSEATLFNPPQQSEAPEARCGGMDRATYDHLRNRLLGLLRDILGHVARGHYNTWLRDRLLEVVPIEFRDDDATRGLVQILQVLPDRECCGTTEAWCCSAMEWFIRERRELMDEYLQGKTCDE